MTDWDRALLPTASPLTPSALAQTVLQRHGLRNDLPARPVSLALLARRESAVVRYRPMLPDGGLVPTPRGYAISINSSLPWVRKRFTLAHELGHLALDHLRRDTSLEHACQVLATIEVTPSRTPEGFDEERFCNQFAGHLLIPNQVAHKLADWQAMSIPTMAEKAHYLQVSLAALLWHVIALSNQDGGFLIFREMGKPTDPKDTKLRLVWGCFPNAGRQYLPRYDAVPDNSPLHAAKDSTVQLVMPAVKLNFGSLRETRSLLVAPVGPDDKRALMAIVVPRDVTLPSDA